MKDLLGDALLSFRLLKVGGIMMFDDYWMGGVTRATAAFEEALGDSVQVLYREKVVQYQLFLYSAHIPVGEGGQGSMFAAAGTIADQWHMVSNVFVGHSTGFNILMPVELAMALF